MKGTANNQTCTCVEEPFISRCIFNLTNPNNKIKQNTTLWEQYINIFHKQIVSFEVLAHIVCFCLLNVSPN